MKNFSFVFVFLFLFCKFSAQDIFPLDSLKLRGVQDFSADDYGNVYIYNNKAFSFTKYDGFGNLQGRMMLTLPYKVQSIHNPLNIALFSQNAQEIKFVDSNLNEIQKLDLHRFGFVKMAYVEDLQQIWLLDESMKRMVQYNFRDDKIINSFPFFVDFENIKDFLVFDEKLYFISENNLKVYNFRAEKLFEIAIENGRKLRRENEKIYIISKNSISKFIFPNQFSKVFESKNSEIVDKNATRYFELKAGKLYLYNIITDQ